MNHSGKQIITIFGDSNALARPQDNILVKDLYSNMIERHGFKVVNYSMYGNHSGRIRIPDNLETDFVVIHVGHVDAAPRIFSQTEKFFLNLISKKFLRKYIRSYIRSKAGQRYDITKNKQKVYVPEKAFRRNMVLLIKKLGRLHVKGIIIINLQHPSRESISRSFGILDNFIKYNFIIQTISGQFPNVRIIDVFGFTKTTPKSVLVDSHITKIVHLYISQKIIEYTSGVFCPDCRKVVSVHVSNGMVECDNCFEVLV